MTTNRISSLIALTYFDGPKVTAYAVTAIAGVLKYGAAGLLGYQVTAKIINLIAHKHPFLDKLATPLCIVGSLSVMAIAHVSLSLAFATVCIAYAVAAIYALPTSYTPEIFKQMLLDGKTFPRGSIIVSGDLNLNNCTSLTSLPQNLHVEGNLDLSYCRNLNSLPPWITTLGLRSDGDTRIVNLIGTGLSQNIIDRLRQEEAPGMRFFFSQAASVPEQSFNTLDKAFTFWKKAFQETDHLFPKIELNGQDLENTLTFLGRLTATAEYQNRQSRYLLAKRVLETFDLMASNPEIRERLLQIIGGGLGACDDRIISALDDIELMVLLRPLYGPDVTEKELRILGQRLLFRDRVDAKACAHALTLTWVNEIEIHLAFRIRLADRFNLPLSTRNMLFRNCAQITDKEIQRAGDAIKAECTQARLDEFLATWDPWTKYQQRLLSAAPYEMLLINSTSTTSYKPEIFKQMLLDGKTFPRGSIIVSGDLNLNNCTSLTSLPQDLHVEGTLYLSYTSLTSLPQGLHVRGNLLLYGYSNLTSLPQGLYVGGYFILHDCTSLTSLPEGLHVGCDLSVYSCTNLTSLPQGLHVRGNLNLSGCTNLTSLPQGLHVRGNLNLPGCTNLTSLPQGLHVGGNLYFTDCFGLTSLPQNLYVGGDLNLNNCVNLTSLPQNLYVGGDLNLNTCISLTSLPDWITTLGLRSNGDTRIVNLIGTGLSQNIIDRLRQVEAPGMRFLFSQAASVPQRTFDTLDEAFTFWKEIAQDTDRLLPTVTLGRQDLDNTLTFLGSLTATAEYQNLLARPVLAKRVLEAFKLLANNSEIRDRVLQIIGGGLGACDDRIISALDDIELMVFLRPLYRPDVTEEELRIGARRLLLRDLVDAKARAHALTLTWVDEIEIHLAFRIGLADRFNLPLSTRNMLFRNSAQITDDQIQKVGDAVEAECTQALLDKFLATWDPWTKYQRRHSVTLYERLSIAHGRQLEKGDKCPISQETPKNPVLYDDHIFDYVTFIEVYIDTGQDPLTRKLIDWSRLQRLQT